MTRTRRTGDRRSASSFATRLRQGARHAKVLGVLDQGVVSFANFATSVAVAKLAGVTALGEYSLAVTIVALLMTVQDCLVASPYSAVVHQLRRAAQRRLAGNLVLFTAVFVTLVGLAVLVAGEILRDVEGLEQFTAIAGVLALVIPAALIRELVRRMALARLDVGAALWIDIAASAFQIAVLAAMASLTSLTSYGASIAIAVGGFSGLGVGLLVEGRGWRIRLRAMPQHLQESLAFGKWLVAARLTSVIHSNTVPWLLGTLLGLDAVGGFAAAFALIAVANPLLGGLLNVLAPQAAQAWAVGGAPALRQVVMRSARMLLSVAALLALPVALFADELLGVLYGSDYAVYGSTAAVLTISLVASVAGTPADYGLRALRRSDGSFASSLCGTTVTMISTLTLVPVLGVIGGAYALALGSSVSAAGRWITFRRLLNQPPPTTATVEPATGF